MHVPTFNEQLKIVWSLDDLNIESLHLACCKFLKRRNCLNTYEERECTRTKTFSCRMCSCAMRSRARRPLWSSYFEWTIHLPWGRRRQEGVDRKFPLSRLLCTLFPFEILFSISGPILLLRSWWAINPFAVQIPDERLLDTKETRLTQGVGEGANFWNSIRGNRKQIVI